MNTSNDAAMAPPPTGRRVTPVPVSKTLLAEWAYGKLYRSNHERLASLPRWLHFYNHQRPHTSLDGQAPMSVLVNNVGGKHT